MFKIGQRVTCNLVPQFSGTVTAIHDDVEFSEGEFRVGYEITWDDGFTEFDLPEDAIRPAREIVARRIENRTDFRIDDAHYWLSHSYPYWTEEAARAFNGVDSWECAKRAENALKHAQDSISFVSVHLNAWR